MIQKIALGLAMVVVPLTVVVGVTLAADDKYAYKSPNGIAISEFKGYESWEAVAVSATDDVVNAIVANPTMIKAYKEGIPGNGQPFPDGSMIAKIAWSKKEDPLSPYTALVPDKLMVLSFILKDSKRFPDSKGWGFAQLKTDAATGKFIPSGKEGDKAFGVKDCFECHTKAKAMDYIFHSYHER